MTDHALKPGVVTGSGYATLVDAAHFNDEDTQRSFLRAVFHDDGRGMTAVPDMETAFASVADRFGMRWRLVEADAPLKTMIAVSTAGHCLVSMLHRWSTGSLPIDIVGIVSNHESLAGSPFDVTCLISIFFAICGIGNTQHRTTVII